MAFWKQIIAIRWAVPIVGAIISGSAHANPSITGISIQCPTVNGEIQCLQPVVGPDGLTAINGFDGLNTLADEHSTIMPIVTGSGGYTSGYTFWVASRTSTNTASSGLVVLQGSVVPGTHQWQLTTDPTYGGGQLFLSPVQHAVALPNAAFDLNYAAPGSVVPDPTNNGNLLMVYSATNRSIGPGPSTLPNGAYNSVGIATSNDGGLTWPSYASVAAIPPDQNTTAGPASQDAMGVTGARACAGYTGMVCNAGASNAYGRYDVLGPTPSIAILMGTLGSTGFVGSTGDGSPSGFVDSHSGSPAPYLYVVDDFVTPPPQGQTTGQTAELTVSRAQLNGGTAPLSFQRWINGSFSDPGLLSSSPGAAAPSPIGFLSGPLSRSQSCEGPNQIQTGGSISYDIATGQYLLTFVCLSPGGDPATGTGGNGAAWFFATNTDLSNESDWSQPQEVGNSWSVITDQGGMGGCGVFDGWYPSLMSTNMLEGELGTDGYVFAMQGCRGDPTSGGGRTFESAYIVIDTNAAVPEPPAALTFAVAVLSLAVMRRRTAAAAFPAATR